MLEHVRGADHAAFEALWVLDSAMADVVARATEPPVGRIRLAWWREALERLDREPPPREPRLEAVADHLLPLGITGAELAELEPGWATLLDETVEPRLVAARGAQLFRLGGRIIGEEDDALADAGALYALASVARRGVPELFDDAGAAADRLAGHRFAQPLRSLTGLARLAMRDLERRDRLEPEGSPGRAAAMLRHRWSGIAARRR